MRLKGIFLVLSIAISYGFHQWLSAGGAFVNVGCANIIDTFVTISAVTGLVVGLLYTFKNSSPGGALIALVAGVIVTVVLSFGLLTVFGNSVSLTATLCNNCSDISKFDDRLHRIEGEEDRDEQRDGYRKLEASVDDFIDVEKARGAQIPDDLEENLRPDVCVADGELFMARLLLSKLTNVGIPELRTEKPKNAESAQLCVDKVSEATVILDRAEAYVNEHEGDQQLVQLIKTHRETLAELGAKCALPDDKSIVVLDKRTNDPNFEVDVKVFDGNGAFITEAESMIEVWTNGTQLESTVTAVNGGEPLCLTVVADNSASIVDKNVNPDGQKNLEYISQALTTLNELRKPDDYYSLITFGGPNEIVQVRNLDKSGVPTDKVDATGGNTAIWDGVKVGIEQLSDCRYPKRMLLLLTDGEDNSSTFMKTSPKTPATDIVKALNRMARDKGIFYNVLAIGPAVKNPDLKSFDTTSGAFVSLNDFAGLSKKISDVVGAQQNFYRISVPMAQLDGVKLLKLRITGGSSEVTVEIGNS